MSRVLEVMSLVVVLGLVLAGMEVCGEGFIDGMFLGIFG